MASMHFQLAALTVLQPVFETLRKEHPEWADDVLAYFADVPWLQPWRLETLRVALQRVQADDHVSALHILVFWVEGTLRDLLRAANVPVIRPDGKGAHLLNKLIRLFAEVPGVGQDAPFHVENVLANPICNNLRNDIGHALAEPDTFRLMNTLLVLHLALLLGAYRMNPKTDDDAKQDGEAADRA